MIETADFVAILPIIVITATAVAVMLVIAIWRNHVLTTTFTVTGLAMTMLSTFIAATQGLPKQVTPLILVDDYSLFFTVVLCAAAIAVTLLSVGYFTNVYSVTSKNDNDGGETPFHVEEFYVLLLVSTLGALILVSSNHFASFFLGLEVLSVPMLAMIAYPVIQKHAIEAGVKFLVLTALASAFLLFGMALIYAQSGSMAFSDLAVAARQHETSLYLVAGVMLIVTGVGFKLSLVPFHMWTPDVYQGAPTPVSAYVATVSKGAMFAVLMRYFFQTDAGQYAPVIIAFTALAVASMLIGNLLALLQNNIKRVLAYSSIAHLGYLLVALIAGKPLAMEAAAYFLVAYIVTNLGAFGIVALLESGYANYKSGDIAGYSGLYWRHPWLAGTLTLMLLSLAGIPLTVGFMGKFYIFAAGVEHTLWLAVYAIVIGSAMGLFYYLRIVVVMFSTPAAEPEPEPLLTSTNRMVAGGVTLAVLTFMLFWLGVYPAGLISIIRETVVGMV